MKYYILFTDNLGKFWYPGKAGDCELVPRETGRHAHVLIIATESVSHHWFEMRRACTFRPP